MRNRLALSCLVCLGVIGGVVLYVVSLPPQIIRGNYQTIQEGMMVAEVEELLGPATTNRWYLETNHVRLAWHSEKVIIWVDFDEQRRVLVKSWVPLQESIGQKLLGWLGLGGPRPDKVVVPVPPWPGGSVPPGPAVFEEKQEPS